ncbi:MAG TPA: histidine kinase, partial [Chitinophagaceae bacterium]|nr:histidine kinase [Chitinophagaceae bacterium]
PPYITSQKYYSLLFQRNGILLGATFNGIVQIDINNEQYKLIHLDDGIPSHRKPDNSVFNITEDADKNVWLGTWSGGLKKYDPVTNSITTFLFSKKPAYTFLNNIVIQILPSKQKKNILWIVSAGEGLHRFDISTGKFESFLTNDTNDKYGIPQDGSGCVYEDLQSHLWIGGENGIFIYDPSKQLIKSKYPAWLNNRDCLKDIFTIYQDPVNNSGNAYWASTWTCGIFKTDSSFEKNIALDYPLQIVNRFLIQTKYAAKDFLRDNNNNLWIAAGLKGLFVVNESKRTIRHFGEAITGLNKTDSFSKVSFVKLLQDKKRTIWASTNSGLYYVDNVSQSLKKFETSMLLNFFIPDLAEDSKGNTWFIRECSNNNEPLVFCINSETKELTSYKEPFMDNFTCQSEKTLKRILVDENNTLWISSSNGLIRAEPKNKRLHIKIFSEKHGLPSSNISHIKNKESGYLWLTTNKGLSIFSKKKERVEKNFSTKDGLYVPDLSYMYKDNKDRLFIDGESGRLNIISSHHTTTDSLKPPVIITGLLLFNKEFLPANESLAKLKELRLAYRQNNIQFEFAALDYTNPSDQQFAYKLEGINTDWVETRQPFAVYNNLEPGNYVFRVKASNSQGIWNEDGVFIKVFIQPPFWKTSWFKASLILLFLFLIYVVFRSRMGQIRKEEQLKHQKTEAEMKALRSQMNPHFIFNCLNTIDAYILRNKQEEASDILQKFSELMRQVLDNSRYDKVLIEKELKALELYVNLEEYILDHHFSHHFSIEPALLENSYTIPPLLLQPFVENAILHGLRHKQTKNGLLTLTLKIQDNQIICLIEDNGIGRKQSAAYKWNNFTKTKSLGMQVTQERIDKLNNLQKNKISLEIIDIEDGDKTGTRVIISLPAEKINPVNL